MLVQSLELQKRRSAASEAFDHWMKLKFDLLKNSPNWSKKRAAWEEKKDEWEEERELAIRKEALKLLDGEASRRGGDKLKGTWIPEQKLAKYGPPKIFGHLSLTFKKAML